MSNISKKISTGSFWAISMKKNIKHFWQGYGLAGVIAVLFAVAYFAVLVISLFIPDYREYWMHPAPDGKPVWTGDSTRTLIYAVVGIAGYVIVLYRFKNSFRTLMTERLNKGIEFLSKERLASREAGLRILERVCEEEINNMNKAMICRIIRDYIIEKTQVEDFKTEVDKLDELKDELDLNDFSEDGVSDDKGKQFEERQDIGLAFVILGNLIGKLVDHPTDVMKFYGKDFKHLEINFANLEGFEFLYCNFSSSALNRANLNNTDMRRSLFKHTKLSEAKIIGANLIKAYFFHSFMLDTNLSNSDLRQARLIKTFFIRTNLSKANLVDARLLGNVFFKANLTDATLKKLDLRYAKLFEPNFTRADLCNSKLTNQYISDAIFKEAKLVEAELSNTKLKNCDFSNADLTSAVMSGTKVKGCDFNAAIMYKTDITASDFSEMNISSSDYDLFDNVVYCSDSPLPILPAGFDLPKSGAYSQVTSDH